jgi:kynurenine formamidase
MAWTSVGGGEQCHVRFASRHYRIPQRSKKNALREKISRYYLLAERGVSLVKALWLEDLAKDQVYEFVFIASPLKLRGATASPIRPLAIPIQRK